MQPHPLCHIVAKCAEGSVAGAGGLLAGLLGSREGFRPVDGLGLLVDVFAALVSEDVGHLAGGVVLGLGRNRKVVRAM